MMNTSYWRGLVLTIFSLRGKLVLSFVGLTLAVTFVSLGFAWYGGRQSGEKLASQTAAQVTARIATHVKEYTREAELIAGSALASVDAGSVVVDNAKSWERYLWQATKVSELATYTFVGTEQGLFVGVERIAGAANAFTRIRMPSDTELRSFEAEEVGDRSHPVPQQTVKYDPRERGWYKQAKAAGGPIFTEPYLSASKKIPVVTYAVPIKNANGEFVGAIAIDFTLVKMAEHLQKLPPSESGVVVLKSAKGITLATSEIIAKTELADDPERTAKLALISKMETLRRDPSQSAVWIEGGTVMSVSPVDGAIKGTVSVAIPAMDIWAGARASMWRVLAVSGLLALAAIGLGVGWLNTVVRDLSALRRAAWQFESGVAISGLPVRRTDEIGSLARAFASMSSRVTSELQSSRSRMELGKVERQKAEETHKLALAKSMEERKRLAAVVDAAQECIAIVNSESVITYANPAFAIELRMPADALIGKRLEALLVNEGNDKVNVLARMQETTQRGETVRETVMMRREDGSNVYIELTLTPVRNVELGAFELAVIGRNVTDAVARTDQLEREAQIDPITQLSRRGPLFDALEDKVRSEKGSPFSLLFLDLDGFKLINDIHGHSAGDQVLAEIGSSIRQHVREGDLAARFGGDEFVVALKDDQNETTAHAVATRLIEAITAIGRHKFPDIQLSASVGISNFPHDSKSVSTLVRYADQAMYVSKRDGGGSWRSWRNVRPHNPSHKSDVVVPIGGRARRKA